MPPIQGAIFPVDPSLGPGDSKYRFNVVVRIVCGPDASETLVQVDTDTRLSYQDAINEAISNVQQETNTGPYSPPPTPGRGEGCTYSGRVTSAGRRADVDTFGGGRR